MADDRYAAFWRRVGAQVVDSLVMIPVAVVAPISVCLLVPFYNVVLQATRGQTLGKVACGVILLRASDETRFGWGRAIAREVFPQAVAFGLVLSAGITYIVLASPTPEEAAENVPNLAAWLIIGFNVANIIAMAFNQRRRTLFDLAAGTVVVKRASLVEPEPAPLPLDYLEQRGLESPHYAPPPYRPGFR